jgi:hypothetical protein
LLVIHRILAQRKSQPYRYRRASSSDHKLMKVEDDSEESEGSSMHSSSHSFGRYDDDGRYDDNEEEMQDYGAELLAQYHAGW